MKLACVVSHCRVALFSSLIRVLGWHCLLGSNAYTTSPLIFIGSEAGEGRSVGSAVNNTITELLDCCLPSLINVDYVAITPGAPIDVCRFAILSLIARRIGVSC